MIPNHICKNPNCGKEYYTCDLCNDNTVYSYRATACSPECFQEVLKIIWNLKDNTQQ